MQEELRADTRAAETGPTAAERSLPLWAEYIQNNDESLDLDSKVQVTSGGEKTKVVVSTQHHKDINIEKLYAEVSEICLLYTSPSPRDS